MRRTLGISNRISTVLGRVALFLVVCLAAYLFGAYPISMANAWPGNPATGSVQNLDPWEIVIYDHPNFEGSAIHYRMDPGMRQKLVPQIAPGWEDQVRSIQAGSEVRLILFAGRNFYAGSNSDYADFFSQRSVAQVRIDFKVGSLIVYPKIAEGPLGVWLWDTRGVIGFGGEHTRERTFFPLPESENVFEQGWPFLGQFQLERNANWLAYNSRYVEVTLYEGRNFQDPHTTFSGGSPGGQYGHADLYFWSDGWADRAASLKVRWVGPPGSLGPKAPPPGRAFDILYYDNLPGSDYKSFFFDGIPEDCQDACVADPKCKAYTWVRPGVQGPKAACWLKSTVPYVVKDPNCVSGYVRGLKPQEVPFPSGQGTVTFTPDISGKWLNSTGTVYKIVQSGAKFTWNVKQFNEQGSGTLTGMQISASWSGDKGTGSTTGKVIVDASGQAIRIEWNNGAVFVRQ